MAALLVVLDPPPLGQDGHLTTVSYTDAHTILKRRAIRLHPSPGLLGRRGAGASDDLRGVARGGRGGPLLSDDPLVLRGGGAAEQHRRGLTQEYIKMGAFS